MGGMGDTKAILQPIMIRAINTESLSQRDPVPGPVSTLTGPLPGQNHIIMYSFYIWSYSYKVFYLVFNGKKKPQS